jgi:hypothetical protein
VRHIDTDRIPAFTGAKMSSATDLETGLVPMLAAGESVSNTDPALRAHKLSVAGHVQAVAHELCGDEKEPAGESDQAAPADPDAHPWEAFNESIRERVIGTLRKARRELAKIAEYDAEKKRFAGQFAQGLGAAGTLGTISSLAKAIERGLPAEPSDKHPGYLTGARVELRDCRLR